MHDAKTQSKAQAANRNRSSPTPGGGGTGPVPEGITGVASDRDEPGAVRLPPDLLSRPARRSPATGPAARLGEYQPARTQKRCRGAAPARTGRRGGARHPLLSLFSRKRRWNVAPAHHGAAHRTFRIAGDNEPQPARTRGSGGTLWPARPRPRNPGHLEPAPRPDP